MERVKVPSYWKKILLLGLVLIAVGSFFIFDLQQYLTLEYFKHSQAEISSYVSENRIAAMLIFFLIYILVTGLSLPGALIMTLVAGALFGLLWGTILVSFASSIGASLAFIISRTLLHDFIQERYKKRLKVINEGVRKDGAFYLFTLRLIPIFPFFIINVVMALTPIRLLTFYLVSQVGMLPGTLVYVNAGTQLAQIDSVSSIVSPGLLTAFVLLGLFPYLAKGLVNFINRQRVYKNYKKPDQFDYNLIVIGAGSAGLVAAYIASAVKARVLLIEKHKMGGDCLNTGCVPSKALIRSSRFLADAHRAEDFGFKPVNASFDFAEIMQRVQTVIRKIEPHDSVERYTELGVECLAGEAEIVSPWEVRVNDRIITTRSMIIAAGAGPFIPPIDGIEQIQYYTSDNIWGLRELPERLVVLGGGPIGCELAQCFATFGSKVTLVEMAPRLLSLEDEEVSSMILESFENAGVDVRLGHKAVKIKQNSERKILCCEHNDQSVEIEFDAILVAVGRKANTEGYGLEHLGIRLTRQGTIEINEYMQTCYPNILACGDVAGPFQFTHTAAHQAWYASVNALFGNLKKFRADYSVIPRATFTDPEVASVGINELEAKEQNIDYEITRYGLDDLDRAIADSADRGLIKVLTVPRKDRILGVTIVGEHAADLIIEYITAMKNNIGLNRILGTIHIYPTLSEANKYAAGNWKKQHAPEKLLRWIKAYHDWMRS
jgi:dihydrolipoamide dehydrogenase